MQRFIAEQNIHHFKDLLAQEQDPSRREMLERMIAEEELKLAEAIADKKQTAADQPNSTAPSSAPIRPSPHIGSSRRA